MITNENPPDERPFNNLLRRLSAKDFALIAPHLAQEEADAGELLYNPGDHVDTVHFPCGPSLATYLVTSEDGSDVETILVGREGAVGGIVSQGYLPAYTRIMVKFGGPFVRLHVGKLDAAKTKSATLRNVFARYADCMLSQLFQSTACNARRGPQPVACGEKMATERKFRSRGGHVFHYRKVEGLICLPPKIALQDHHARPHAPPRWCCND